MFLLLFPNPLAAIFLPVSGLDIDFFEAPVPFRVTGQIIPDITIKFFSVSYQLPQLKDGPEKSRPAHLDTPSCSALRSRDQYYDKFFAGDQAFTVTFLDHANGPYY